MLSGVEVAPGDVVGDGGEQALSMHVKTSGIGGGTTTVSYVLHGVAGPDHCTFRHGRNPPVGTGDFETYLRLGGNKVPEDPLDCGNREREAYKVDRRVEGIEQIRSWRQNSSCNRTSPRGGRDDCKGNRNPSSRGT